MFNFKLTPIWLFAIVLIVLIISMMWYNNASIEGFVLDKELLNYPNNGLIKFGLNETMENRGNYFDTKTGNIIREYDQTFTVINRGGGQKKYIKSDLSGNIDVNIEEQLKNQTYGAFSMYEAANDEQLFYVSVNDDTFIHAIDISANGVHKKSFIFNPGRFVKEELVPEAGEDTTTTTTTKAAVGSVVGIIPTTASTTHTFADIMYDVSGVSTNVKELVPGLLYDPSNGMIIATTVADEITVSKYEKGGDDMSSSVVINHGNVQLIKLVHMTKTVLMIVENIGTAARSKYNLIGTLRYDGSTLIVPVQPPVETEQQLEDAVVEEDEQSTDLTESSMSEYWKWFHYWNAGGSGSGSNQPMSQDYMLKTEHVPSTCSSCTGKDCGGGACTSCGGGDSCNGGGGGGGRGGGNGVGGIANNVINTTGDLAEKVVDTGAGMASGAVGAGREVASGAVGLGREVARGGRDAVGGAVDLGKDTVGGAVGLSREVASGGYDVVGGVVSGAVGLGREVLGGTVGLGRDVVGGAANLGRDAVGGTANFIKDTQRNGTNSGAGGYASGGGGNVRTRKYVSGQQTTGGTDPYTYNGALAKRGGSNFMPLTADFSSF